MAETAQKQDSYSLSDQLMPFGRYRGQPISSLLSDLPYLRWLLNQSWFVQGQDQTLVQVLRALQATVQTDTPAHEAATWFEEGLRLRASQRRREAIKAFEQVLAIDPLHFDAILEKSELEWPEQALRTLERALVSFPNHPRLLMRKAQQLELLERHLEAHEAYEDALLRAREQAMPVKPKRSRKQQPEDPMVAEIRLTFCLSLMKWGSTTLQEGYFDETLSAMQRLHQLTEGEPLSWRMYGLALIEMRRPSEALPWLEKAIKANANDDRSWKAKGRAYHALEQFREAAVALERATRLNQQDANAWFLLGLACDEIEKPVKAELAYHHALELEPNDAFFWYCRGSARYNNQRYQEALADLTEAYRRDPELSQALFLISMCYSHMDRLIEAIQLINQVLAVNPRNDEALYNRACYYSRCGDRERALEDLRHAVKLDTTWREAAREDDDFNSIRGDEEFSKIVS